MSGPLSSKSVAGGVGTLAGGGTGITIAELLGQLHVFDDANQNVVKALGGIIALAFAVFGSRWMSWWTKESDDFLAYAANESGKMLVDVGTKVGVPEPELVALAQKIDAIGIKLDSKVEADAEKLLKHYLPALTGTVRTDGPLPAAPAPVPDVHVVQVTPTPTAAADPVAAAPEVDPVLADDYQPAGTESDPVLAD